MALLEELGPQRLDQDREGANREERQRHVDEDRTKADATTMHVGGQELEKHPRTATCWDHLGHAGGDVLICVPSHNI